eukprot:1753342-Amphidinium_carterae.3
MLHSRQSLAEAKCASKSGEAVDRSKSARGSSTVQYRHRASSSLMRFGEELQFLQRDRAVVGTDNAAKNPGDWPSVL